MDNPVIKGKEHYLQNVAVDNVIFGYHNKQLKVLLLKPIGIEKWVIPGGYIKKDETIEDAANRIASERTGLKSLYMKQFKSFGDPKRNKDKDFTPELLSKLSNVDIDKVKWMFDYFVSIGFYTITNFSRVQPQPAEYMRECKWWNVSELPTLQQDFEKIINEAMKALKIHIYHHPIGMNLLPSKFTLPEIQTLYETISNKEIDSRNFAKRLKNLGLIKKLDEKKNIGGHRSPFLYEFDKENYKNALENGTALIL